MANDTQQRAVALWHGRPVVTLSERYGHERLFQGIVVGPEGMTHADALRRIDELFREAVEADSEEWTYGDVLDRLVADGFEAVQAAEWWEHRVEMSSD